MSKQYSGPPSGVRPILGGPRKELPDVDTMQRIIAEERKKGRLPFWTGRSHPEIVCHTDVPESEQWEPVVRNGRFQGYVLANP
jgi:hypothetical protein